MTVPYSFANATVSIPLSQLDANFNTAITLGNTAIQLGNTVTTLNNMTLANVTISSGNVTITNVTVTTANVTTVNASTVIATTANVTTANITTGNVTNMSSGNVTITGGSINGTTLGASTASTANVTTLTTSSTVTLNGGTANGVAYLDGSKVLTTGSALTYTGSAMSVNSGGVGGGASMALTVNGTFGGGIQQSYNNNGGSALVPVSGGGLIFYTYTGANASEAYSEQMRLTSTGLGIGTSAPAYKLTVYNGAAVFQNAETGTGVDNGFFVGNSSASTGYVWNFENFPILFGTNNTERMRISATGDVGIGTSSPATKLHISGSTTPNLRFEQTNSSVVHQFQAASGNFYLNIDATNAIGGSNFFIQQVGTSVLELTPSGNLGLGVTPSAWVSTFKAIQVGNGASFQGQTNSVSVVHVSGNAYVDSGSTYRYIGTGEAAQRYQQYLGAHSWYTAASGTAGDPISFTQALTLDADGKLILGSTSAPGAHMMKVTNSTQAGIICTGANSVANDGSFTVEVSNGTILMVSENNTGDGALFFCGYKSATITLISDPNNRYATSITAGRICVTKSANSGTITITNKIGSTQSITVGKFSTSD